MAIWISSNIDIGRSLNSRDSFFRWKFKNRAPIGCSPGPILWRPTISFELHAEMAEEIDLEKCTFRNFGSSVTLTLTLDWVEVTLVHICGRGLPTHQIRWKSEKLFVDVRTDVRTDGRTEGRTHLSSNLLGHRRGDDLKIGLWCLSVNGSRKFYFLWMTSMKIQINILFSVKGSLKLWILTCVYFQWIVHWKNVTEI